MLSRKEIRALEKEHGFSPQKRLGQNFLIDGNIKNKIVEAAGVGRDDTLLEIGSGLGQLTFDFASLAKKIIAVEFDKKLYSILSGLTHGRSNIILVHEDFLKLDIKGFLPKDMTATVVSNLPYYISTPVILKLFAHSEHIGSAILTLQKEVADRLLAEPRTKAYGSLTLYAEYHAEIKRLFNISRNSFYPPPKVDSTVISLKMRKVPPVAVSDKSELFELIRAGFSKRRKTLVNALLLQKRRDLSRERIEKALDAAGIPREVRAEALRLSDFAGIAEALKS